MGYIILRLLLSAHFQLGRLTAQTLTRKLYIYEVTNCKSLLNVLQIDVISKRSRYEYNRKMNVIFTRIVKSSRGTVALDRSNGLSFYVIFAMLFLKLSIF